MKRGRKPKGFVNLHLQLNPADLAELKQISEQHKITVNELIREAIKLYIVFLRNTRYWPRAISQIADNTPVDEVSRKAIDDFIIHWILK